MKTALALSIAAVFLSASLAAAQDCSRPQQYGYGAPNCSAPAPQYAPQAYGIAPVYSAPPAVAYEAPPVVAYSMPVQQYQAPVYAAPVQTVAVQPQAVYVQAAPLRMYYQSPPPGYAFAEAGPAIPPGARHYRYRVGLFGPRVDAW